MNERIEELESQCIDPKWTVTGPMFDREKFAELIVLECVKTLQTEMRRLDAIAGREISAQTIDTAQALIKKHFGVNE